MSRNATYVDPTRVRLSDHFLLSDFIGCHSVYTSGYRNLFEDPDGSKEQEGVALCEEVLEPILVETPLSISYGYISLELARRIVTYQSPEKPSYHQWNDGAACDITLHGEPEWPPIHNALWMDAMLPMSRTITYSESPYICVGIRCRELDAIKRDHTETRHALYENRYEGERKPRYIQYSDNARTRARQRDEAMEVVTADNWQGAGYPTYHGGGRRQLQHIRVGKHCMYSDFMFSKEAVRQGRANALTPTDRNLARMRRIGALYDTLLERLQVNRLSIIRAYESPVWSGTPWVEDFRLELVPPRALCKASDIADAAQGLPGVHTVGASNRDEVAVISGYWRDILHAGT